VPDKAGKYQAELFVTDKHNSSLPAMVDITVPTLAVNNTASAVPHHNSEPKKSSPHHAENHEDANPYRQELPLPYELGKPNRNSSRNVMPWITPYGFDAR